MMFAHFFIDNTLSELSFNKQRMRKYREKKNIFFPYTMSNLQQGHILIQGIDPSQLFP